MHRLLPCSLVFLLLPACSSSAPKADAKASAADVDALIQRGRTLLDEGKPAEAERLFTEAADHDHGTISTRMWVLRSWMDQGRSNDTLDALDALRSEERRVGKECRSG